MKNLKKVFTALKCNKVALTNSLFQYNSTQVALFGKEMEIVLFDHPGDVGTLYQYSDTKLIPIGKVDQDDIDYVTKRISIETDSFQPISDDLRAVIDLSIPFIGNDDLRPIMSGMYFGTDKQTAATDAHVLHADKHDLELTNSVIIPTNILRLPFTQIKFAEHSEMKAVVKWDDITIYFNLIEGRYPNFNAVVPNRDYYTKCVTISSNELKEITDMATAINKQMPGVYISDGKMFCNYEDNLTEIKTVSIEDVKGGAEQNTIIMPMMKPDGVNNVYIGFNAKFLKNITPANHTVKLYWFDDNKAIRLEFIPEKKTTTKKVVKPSSNNNDEIIKELQRQIQELKKENELLKNNTVKVDQAIKDLEIVNYSDKCVALFGEYTKQKKDYIKNELKGLFNTRLKYNDGTRAGWIVSNKYSNLLASL